MLPVLVFNSTFLAWIVVHPYIYHHMKLKNLLLAALLDYLQKKFLKHFKYSKSQDDDKSTWQRRELKFSQSLSSPLFSAVKM